ncbi:MAG: hypothetical protein RIB59_13620 [Rhodospirillales bacterium]
MSRESPQPRQSEKGREKTQARKAKLAKALRQNLLKRRQQTKVRKDPA